LKTSDQPTSNQKTMLEFAP